MATQIGIIPRPAEITIQVWGGNDRRMRVMCIDAMTTLHVPNRDVLDALQAALDAIRADMDVEAAAELEAVAS